MWFQTDEIIDRIAKPLLGPEVNLSSGLRHDLAGTEFAPALLPTDAIVVYRPASRAVRSLPSPQILACLIDGPQQWPSVDAGSKTPTVDRLLHPCRNGSRPDMATFP